MTDRTVSAALSETYKHFSEEMKSPFYGISPKVFSLPTFSMSPQCFEESSSIALPAWDTILHTITGDGKQKTLPVNIGEETTGFFRLQLADD